MHYLQGHRIKKKKNKKKQKTMPQVITAQPNTEIVVTKKAWKLAGRGLRLNSHDLE